MRRVAIIPARGGSKRLPRKNILALAGHPMLSYPIVCARKSGLFDEIIVSSEDPEILKSAEKYGALPMVRHENIATDTAPVTSVCLDVLQQLGRQQTKFDIFCCIYATAVFLEAKDLIQSEGRLHATGADVVMGVSGYPLHPYKALQEDKGFLSPAFPDKVKVQSQHYPDFVASNGTFYWARTNKFMEKPDFYPERLAGFVIPINRAPDIDTEEDFEQVKLTAKLYFNNKGEQE